MIARRRVNLAACLGFLAAAWFGFFAVEIRTWTSGTDALTGVGFIPPRIPSDPTTVAGVEVSVREMPGASTRGRAPFGGALDDALRPYRLLINYRAVAPTDVGFVPSRALARAMGPACFARALGPLVSAEMVEGDLEYGIGIALDAVTAVREAGRFPTPSPGPWMLLTLCLAAVAAAVLAFRRRPLPTRRMASGPPDFMVRDRAAAQSELERLAEAVAAGSSELAAKKTADASQGAARSGLGRLNIVRTVREGRGRRQAAADTAALAEKVAGLLAQLARARARQTGIDRAIMAEVAAEERRFGRKAALGELARIAPQVAAFSLFTLAILHAAAAFLAPGLLMLPPVASPTLVRGDTLIGTALAAHPEYVTTLAEHCMVTVVFPEPSATLASTSPRPVSGGPEAVSPVPPPVFPPSSVGPRCTVGTPCGEACIPAGRVCRIASGDPGHGRACGNGYIAMSKTCRIERQASDRRDQSVRQDPPPPFATGAGGQAAAPPQTTADVASPPSTDRTMPSGSGTPAPSASTRSDTVHVQGYTRQDGRVVQPYDRAAPRRGHK